VDEGKGPNESVLVEALSALARDERLPVADRPVAVLAEQLARAVDIEAAGHAAGGKAYTVDRLARAYCSRSRSSPARRARHRR
jgi:hypothetical protein